MQADGQKDRSNSLSTFFEKFVKLRATSLRLVLQRKLSVWPECFVGLSGYMKLGVQTTMKRLISVSLSILSVAGMLVATEHRATAFTGYVDPGSGLLAIQCIASAFATACYFMRRRIAALFGSKKDKVQSVESHEVVANSSLNEL